MSYKIAVLRQLYTLGYACLDYLNIRIWLRYKVHRSDLQAVELSVLIDCQKYYRNRHEIIIDLHLGYHLASVHARHVQIENYKVNLSFIAAEYFEGFLAVRGIQYVVLFLQKITKDLAVALYIIGNQYTFADIDNRNLVIDRIILRHGILRRQGLFDKLLSLIHSLVGLFKNTYKRVMTCIVVFDHSGCYGSAHNRPRRVLRNGTDLFHQFFPLFIILSGQNNHELIAADSEYRTVAEDTAYLSACSPDALVTFFMSVQVIYRLKVIDIAYYYRERSLHAVLYLRVNRFFPLNIGMFVLRACQRIDGSHSPCGRKLARVFLFLAYLNILVHQSYDQHRLPVFFYPRRFQPDICRKAAAQQPVVHHEHTVPLYRRKNILLRDLGMKQSLILRMDSPEAVLKG